MVCIYCQAKTQIVNSRHQARNNTTWRRRQCLKCGALLTTIEEADYSRLWALLDKEGHITAFLRNQLFVSVYESLKHRRTALDDASALTATIIARLSKSCPEGQISRDKLIDTTHSVLKRFDKVAAVHYKAFYPLDQ